YFRARNYDIYSRDALAQAGYQKLINDFPSAAETEQALYFLGVLYNEGGNYQSSAATFEQLLRDFPQSQWQASARYYLGCNYELLGNMELSAGYYKAASDLYKASSPDSLSSGELKLIERIYMSK
ncbi:tetratricopeptide repeat protein, partial [bacterium]